MDLARPECFLEYGPARVTCPEHGVRAERVPWARHGSRCTRDFEGWVACLAVRCCVPAHSRIARVEWHSVGGICGRVYDETVAQRGVGRFDGLRRIGIDETGYKKGHKYLTVVVGHDRGRPVWAHEGYGKEVLGLFLDEPAREQRRAIEVVTADGAKWIKALARRGCPNARWAMDPFRVAEWTSDALDEAGREEGRGDPAGGQGAEGGCGRDQGKPLRAGEEPGGPHGVAAGEARRAQEGGRLFTAWDLKEDLRAVFRAGTAVEAEAMLDGWLHRAAYREIGPVVAVENTGFSE